MQVAANNIFSKTSRDITAGIRNTSCNRGWLQVFTHIVCGVFTVTSFILILIVAFNTTKTKPNIAESRCQLSGCRVICHETPFYEEYEDDIVLGIMQAAEVNCHSVFLTLTEPRFTNESLPQNWLTRLRPVVVEIGIIGGNLHHIPQDAFSAAFARNVRLLLLEEITITSWSQHAFLGLANLDNILIKKCNIIDMQENFLSAVSQSLSTLTVVESGYWNPKNLTGSSDLASYSMLTWVDLSSNDFGANLGLTSFTRLRYCKSLYLASNRISYIEPGTFDNLIKLEYLNLNNNFLNRIEPGLFNVMSLSSTPKVRLNLVENWWHCDCSDRELRRLTAYAILLVDPICNSPKSALGKTFYEFVAYCKENEPKQIVAVDMQRKIVENEGSSIETFKCVSKTSQVSTSRVISPFHNYQCSESVLDSLSQGNSTVTESDITKCSLWIKPVIFQIGDNFTMVELSLSRTEGHGLIWYQNSCANEVFCVNVLPDTIRLYNIDIYNEYTFCPVDLKSGSVESSHCIDVLSKNTSNSSFITRLILYPLIAIGSLFFGALILYMLIRKYPFLLKGSKRLLFVKHKTVDALVLPPKVPLRGVQSNISFSNSKDFPDITTSLYHDFMRSGSMRSCHSIAPSYISALHPTEEQLADWRLKHANERFDSHYATVSIISSEVPVSLSSNSDHFYFSIEDDSPIVSISDPISQSLEYEPDSVS
ncbi:uncharacterized protein LOC133521003 [Cydia pomonella]|uniref:uncharacterized protein LOC133521003 n=1 Tax=Cydia pomonella TaxID=82600 RepID=UPI002ADD87E0|nr:uncharacterized protein LOC133521003 [Cydia pomonella]